MRKMLLTVISFVALSALVACGGGSSNSVTVPAPPSGGNSAGFSNASLTGNYVFAVSGGTQNNNFAVTGVFTADGNGNVTGGVRDTVNDSGGQTLNESITGNYSVNQDGRGQVVLNGGSGQVIYRFVLQSSSSLQSPIIGKLFQDGTTSNNVIVDGTGRIEAQSPPSTTLTGPYAVRLDGEDSNRSIYGAVGGLTISGSSIGGTIDENDSGAVNTLLPISTTTTPNGYGLSANGRGTLSYVTPNSTATTLFPPGSHNFIVYYVSPNHLELLSTDQKFFLHGYADLQTSVSANAAAFTGGQVFSISGYDTNGFRVETGRATPDGAGTLSNAIEDVNTEGAYYAGVSLTGSSYTVGSGGRWTASLVGTPLAGSTTSLVGWQVSPQQSVVLTTSPTIVETGTMRAQTTSLSTLTNANVAGNYAQDFSGYNSSAQSSFELTGNFYANGAGGLGGTYDMQSDINGLSLDIPTSGTYTVDPTLGRNASGNINGFPVVIYTVDQNTMYVISAEQYNVAQGMLVSQQP